MITVNSFTRRVTDVLEKISDRIAPASLITGHALHHAYDYGLYVILSFLYTELGLTPVTAGLMDTAR